jgi:ADP-ribosylglycohydrolase
MMIRNRERLARARISLEGLSTADSLGGYFEFTNTMSEGRQRRLPSAPWPYTDDTQMALSIYTILAVHDGIDQDALALHFAEHYEPRGYGAGTRAMLAKIRKGEHWQTITHRRGQGGGSWGNGGPMRIAPLGVYFADDLAAVVEQTRLATVVTHAHPEAIAGSIAVAVAAALAYRAGQAQKRPARHELLTEILSHTPDSLVKTGIAQARDLPDDTPHTDVVQLLGNGYDISSHHTVPLCLWHAGMYLDNYEEAIWQTINAGGDADTLAAIVGGIVAAYTGVTAIPPIWRQNREPLPDWIPTL